MKPIKAQFPNADDLSLFNLKDGSKLYSDEKLEAKEYCVESYSELIALTSLLNTNNQDYFLLYRGQTEQFGLSFLPSIYRNISDQKKLHDRFEKLKEATEILKKSELLPEKNCDIIAQSIIQHYFDKAGTPFLDLTNSLRVAYTFAMSMKSSISLSNTYGYIYIFGIPYPKEAISSDSEITNIRLLTLGSVCALRPFFQEGYLVCDNNDIVYLGTSPDITTIESRDFKNRLIAEIRIPVEKLSDDKYFHRIPNNSLLDNHLDTFFSKQGVKQKINDIYKD